MAEPLQVVTQQPVSGNINVFVYIYPTTVQPGITQPDIDDRFPDLVLALVRAGLHFVASLPTVGNVLPSLQWQLRSYLNSMRIAFPHLGGENQWAPVKFFRTTEAEPWRMRAVSRADVPDRYFTLDRLVSNGILHAQPPHPEHETLMLWLAPRSNCVTGPLEHFMDANAYRLSGARGSYGSDERHGCYAARVVWPLLQRRSGTGGEPECGTDCPNALLSPVARVPSPTPPATVPVSPAARAQERLVNTVVAPIPPQVFDDAQYHLGLAEFAACVAPSPSTNPPPTLETWKREVNNSARGILRALGHPNMYTKLEIDAKNVPAAVTDVLKYARQLSIADAGNGGLHAENAENAGDVGRYIIRDEGRVRLAGPQDRRLLFATMGLKVFIGGASGPGPAIAVLQGAIARLMRNFLVWTDNAGWKIPVFVSGVLQDAHAYAMQETGLLCALLLFHYTVVPSTLHPVVWVAMQSTISDALEMTKSELLTLKGMPEEYIRAWRIDEDVVDLQALRLLFDSDVEMENYLALSASGQEAIRNGALREMLLRIPLEHGDTDVTTLAEFRKGFHVFYNIIPFPRGDELAEITKYFWNGTLKKPCDVLGRLCISFRGGRHLDTSETQPSEVLSMLRDEVEYEDGMFLIMLHQWIEGRVRGDVTNAVLFLRACTEQGWLAPDQKIQIEFTEAIHNHVQMALGVCSPSLTVSVGYERWIWDMYVQRSEAALGPDMLFDAFFDGLSDFNAP